MSICRAGPTLAACPRVRHYRKAHNLPKTRAKSTRAAPQGQRGPTSACRVGPELRCTAAKGVVRKEGHGREIPSPALGQRGTHLGEKKHEAGVRVRLLGPLHRASCSPLPFVRRPPPVDAGELLLAACEAVHELLLLLLILARALSVTVKLVLAVAILLLRLPQVFQRPISARASAGTRARACIRRRLRAACVVTPAVRVAGEAVEEALALLVDIPCRVAGLRCDGKGRRCERGPDRELCRVIAAVGTGGRTMKDRRDC